MITNKVKATDSIAEKIVNLYKLLSQKIKDYFKMIDDKLDEIDKKLEESDYVDPYIDPNFYYYF